MLDDDIKSRYLQKDGSYLRPENPSDLSVQDFLLNQARERQKDLDTILKY